jgi:SpoVK/Ycf46/Vps4 family AAA+-type ATPase
VSPNLSPTAELLVDTIRCIRMSNSFVPRSFLLTGPPGEGKTFSVRLAMEASEAQGPTKLVSLQGSELLSTASHPADASKALERHFHEVACFCRNDKHVGIIFVDECEALLSSDAVAAMFGNLLDKVSSASDGWQRIVVVAATNRIDAVPAWLRRPGRLDREVALGPPDAAVRLQLLKSLLKQSTLEYSEAAHHISDDDLISVAEACVGYVPADLAALVRRAALLAFQEDKQQVTADLLKRAMADVGASVSMRDCYFSFYALHYSISRVYSFQRRRRFEMLPCRRRRKQHGMTLLETREAPR